MAIFGQAKKLKTISQTEILRAKLQIEEMKLKSKGFSDEKILHVKEKMLSAQNQIKKLKDEYKKFKSEFSSEEKLSQIKHDISQAQMEFKIYLEQWKFYLSHPEPIKI